MDIGLDSATLEPAELVISFVAFVGWSIHSCVVSHVVSGCIISM